VQSLGSFPPEDSFGNINYSKYQNIRMLGSKE
jgi:hypothetical protein